METESPKVLDDAVLQSLFDLTGSDELIKEIATLFVRSAPDLFSAYERAYQDGDAKIMASIAHRFKGSAGNLGATRLYKVAEKIENKLRAGATVAELDNETSQSLRATFQETASELERRHLI